MAKVAKRTWTHNGVPASAWVVRYFDPGGKRRSKQFDLKKDADRYRQKVEREMNDGCHVPDGEAVTIAKACEQYLRHSEDRVRDGRIGASRHRTLKFSLGKGITSRIGHVRCTDLTAAMIEDLHATIVREDGLLPRTARVRLVDLGLVEDFAFKRGMTNRKVIPDALRELRGMPRARIRTFTSEEVLRLVRAAETSRVAYNWRRPWHLRRVFVNIAAFCGLRFGEIRALTVDNIDMDRRIIKVRHSLTFLDELKGPKTAAGRRDVPMPTHVARLIAEWTDLYHVPNERNLIFRSRENNLITAQAFHEHGWRPLLAEAGLTGGSARFHFHALRHFYASWLIENQVPVTEVAVLLGHSKFDMTLQTYAHPIVSEARRQEAVDRMTAALLTPSPGPIAAMVTQQPLNH